MAKEDRKANPSVLNRRGGSESRSHESKQSQRSQQSRKRLRSPQNSLQKQWDEINCPICMEFPHNAVLLICSQHEKGCQPFMCDTSHRHSNCLDQFRRTRRWPSATPTPATAAGNQVSNPNSGGDGGGARRRVLVLTSEGSHREVNAIGLLPLAHMRRGVGIHVSSTTQNGTGGEERFPWRPGNNEAGNGGRVLAVPSNPERVEGEGGEDLSQKEQGEADEDANGKALLAAFKAKGEAVVQAECGLLCPLCRSAVFGWRVVKDVRAYLDLKIRSCSQETCNFSGAYGMLRSHARDVHPSARPQEANPERVEEWQRLQRQQDTDDVLSSIQAAMPGARILGDYMIEDNNDDDAEAMDGSDSEGLHAVTDLDFLFPIMEIMSQLASGPSHQRRGISWGLGIGPPTRRRGAFAIRSGRLPPNPNSNSNSSQRSPPVFPVLPPVPLGGAMPSGDPTDNPIRPRSRWGDIPGSQGRHPEFLTRGGRQADPMEQQRQRMVSEIFEQREAIRRRLNREQNGGGGSPASHHH